MSDDNETQTLVLVSEPLMIGGTYTITVKSVVRDLIAVSDDDDE